jgi:hypothetical protein
MAYSPSVSPSLLSFSLYLSVNLLQPAAQCTVEPRSAVHRGAPQRSAPWSPGAQQPLAGFEAQ